MSQKYYDLIDKVEAVISDTEGKIDRATSLCEKERVWDDGCRRLSRIVSVAKRELSEEEYNSFRNYLGIRLWNTVISVYEGTQDDFSNIVRKYALPLG